MSSSTWPSSHCISRLLQSCFCFCCWQLCLCWWVDVTCIGRNRILEPPGGQYCLLQFELQDVTEQGGLLGQTGQHLVFCGLHCCTHHCQNPLHKMSNTVLVRSQKISPNAPAGFLFYIPEWVWPLYPVPHPQGHRPPPEWPLTHFGAPSAAPPSEATWRQAQLDDADAPTHADLCPAVQLQCTEFIRV